MLTESYFRRGLQMHPHLQLDAKAVGNMPFCKKECNVQKEQRHYLREDIYVIQIPNMSCPIAIGPFLIPDSSPKVSKKGP